MEITPEIALALEMLDALMVVATRGWTHATLAFESAGGGRLHVANVATTMGDAGALATPETGLDATMFRAVLDDVASELRGLVRAWDGTTATVARSTDTSTLTLANLDGRAVKTVVLDRAVMPLLIVTEALYDAWGTVMTESHERQRAFDADVKGYDTWRFDQAEGTLVLDRGSLPWRSLRAEVIGTYVREPGELTWAWSNPTVHREASRSIRAVRDAARAQPGLGVFLRPSIPCELPFARTLVSLAAMSVDARAVFATPSEAGTVYLLVQG